MAHLDPDDVIAVVKEFVLTLPHAPADVSAETELLISGLLDSLSVFSLVARLEQRFSVTIPPGDIAVASFETAAAIAAYLCKGQGGSA